MLIAKQLQCMNSKHDECKRNDDDNQKMHRVRCVDADANSGYLILFLVYIYLHHEKKQLLKRLKRTVNNHGSSKSTETGRCAFVDGWICTLQNSWTMTGCREAEIVPFREWHGR